MAGLVSVCHNPLQVEQNRVNSHWSW